jgi:cytochrome P450
LFPVTLRETFLGHQASGVRGFGVGMPSYDPDARIDVDHHDPGFLAARHDRYAELRRRCPVVFNEHYGGYWLVTDHESVAAVARDNETFAHRY